MIATMVMAGIIVLNVSAIAFHAILTLKTFVINVIMNISKIVKIAVNSV